MPGNRAAVAGGFARVAAVPAAALGVHQLRYLLAFSGSAGAELQRQGHSYLHSLVPWIVLGLGLAVGGFLSGLGRAFVRHTAPRRYGISLLALWALCATSLIAIYVSQEFLEGIFATGHPGGLGGVFGYGGWWAIPASAAVGLVLAVFFHGARWAITKVAGRHTATSRAIARRRVRSLRPAGIPPPRLAPLALGWSGRGPPS
ncbi:MAG: hypothetical protein ACRDNK_18360 [Solirubrobacteraceae bacterium]